MGDRHVVIRERRRGVRHEHHQVGASEGRLGLAADPFGELIAADFPSTRVDDEEIAAVPLRKELASIPSDTRGLLHHCGATTQHAVDERGLAHIGTAHDGDDGDAAHEGAGEVGMTPLRIGMGTGAPYHAQHGRHGAAR